VQGLVRDSFLLFFGQNDEIGRGIAFQIGEDTDNLDCGESDAGLLSGKDGRPFPLETEHIVFAESNCDILGHGTEVTFIQKSTEQLCREWHLDHDVAGGPFD